MKIPETCLRKYTYAFRSAACSYSTIYRGVMLKCIYLEKKNLNVPLFIMHLYTIVNADDFVKMHIH